MAKKKKSQSPAEPTDPSTKPVQPPPPPKPEIDPKWKWPPFPTPPEGITLVSFDQFQPKGIKLSLDDAVEVDGDGVKTVELQVKHNLTGHKKGKKKKKDPLAELSEEEIRKMTWDKRWELSEELRNANPLDHFEPLVDRFIESTRLFHNGRPWDRQRQEIWDQFRIYGGVISGLKRPPSNKPSQYYDENEEESHAQADGEDDDLSDDELSNPAAAPDAASDEVSEEARPKNASDFDERAARNEEKYQALLAQREERPYYWVEDPERATKIYLSSHFRDKGLLWLRGNARDMPILLRYYFEFVLRNKLFFEKDFNRKYEKALAVAKRAEIELVASNAMSWVLPDDWGKACTAFWGQLYYTTFEKGWKPSVWTEDSPLAAETTPSEATADDSVKLVNVEYDHGKTKVKEETAPVPAWKDESVPEFATIEEQDQHTAEEPEANPTDQDDPSAIEAGEAGGWGGWEESGPKQDGAADLLKTWGVPPLGEEDSQDQWDCGVTPTILAFLGPTEYPLRRIPIRLEQSTRIIVDIIPPQPDSNDMIASHLATLVLQPWPTPSDDEDSMVTPPKMLDFWAGAEDAELKAARDASLKDARNFDPTQDEIRVHVDPKVIQECRVGLGVGAIWVQIGRRADADANSGASGAPKKKKKSSGGENWYMERLEWVIPSYWTPNDVERDMTRRSNNPDFAYVE